MTVLRPLVNSTEPFRRFVISARCPGAHEETIRVEGSITRAWVDSLAALIDGGGKCDQCLGPLACTVIEL